MSLGSFFEEESKDTNKLKAEHERFRKCLEEMAKDKERPVQWYIHVAQVALGIQNQQT